MKLQVAWVQSFKSIRSWTHHWKFSEHQNEKEKLWKQPEQTDCLQGKPVAGDPLTVTWVASGTVCKPVPSTEWAVVRSDTAKLFQSRWTPYCAQFLLQWVLKVTLGRWAQSSEKPWDPRAGKRRTTGVGGAWACCFSWRQCWLTWERRWRNWNPEVNMSRTRGAGWECSIRKPGVV